MHPANLIVNIEAANVLVISGWSLEIRQDKSHKNEILIYQLSISTYPFPNQSLNSSL